MSKSLLNLLVQIFKALVYSNIKFLLGKEFFRHFRPSHGPFSFLFNRPFFPFSSEPRPLGRPRPPSQPNRSSSSSRTKAKCRRPTPPRFHPAMGALPRAPHRIPRRLPLLPSSFHRVKHWLKSEPFHPINAGNSSALTTPFLPPRPL
jgi:hypothetical protein